MDVTIEKPLEPVSGLSLTLTGSKSESNRLLVLQKLFTNLQLSNVSNSDDTAHLSGLLSNPWGLEHDIGHAGTAMRFGCAYLSSLEGVDTVLKGSERMHERPIGILVDALRDLGADITYLKKEGFPPLRIRGKRFVKNEVTIDGSVSSQYLTALLLIAPALPNGLNLNVVGKLTSLPYLEMTINLLREIGVNVKVHSQKDENAKLTISVLPQGDVQSNHLIVESDWSSAGYWYSWVALQEPGYSLCLNHFKTKSLQGDSSLIEMYQFFGVDTVQDGTTITLTKIKTDLPSLFAYDMTAIPDQAQTVFATCLGLGINAQLKGLHTLKIKETDRIEAMKVVGSRFRESEIITTNNSIELYINKGSIIKDQFIVDTYNDHRMAMSFAPLCMFSKTVIKDSMVVSKSYPEFWRHLKLAGCRFENN